MAWLQIHPGLAERLLFSELQESFFQAGEIALRYHGRHDAALVKAGPNPEQQAVTQGDLEVNRFLVETFGQRYSNLTIYSEESGFLNPNQAYRMILDPIDGSHRQYAAGLDFFSITGAVQQLISPGEYETIMGVTYLPARLEMIAARKGKGLHVSSPLIEKKVSRVSALDQAIIVDEEGWDGQKQSEGYQRYLKEVIVKERQQPYSSAAVLAYIATGRIDGLTFITLSPHDFEAGKLVIEEAGGRFDLFHRSGTEYVESRFDIVASNGIIHDRLLEVSGRKR